MEQGNEILAKLIGKENEFLIFNKICFLGRSDTFEISEEMRGIENINYFRDV